MKLILTPSRGTDGSMRAAPLGGYKLDLETPLLRAVRKGGHIVLAGISGDGLHAMVKRRAELAGLRDEIGFHSLRAGFITQCRRNGADARSIRLQTRHSSDAMIDITTGSTRRCRERRLEAGTLRSMDSELHPACWSWPIPKKYPNLSRKRDADLPPSIQALLPAIRKLLAYCPVELTHQQAFHDGRCAICGRKNELVEDHDHNTGLFRGWLCRSCNTSEGCHPTQSS